MNAPDTTDLMGSLAGDSASLRSIRVAIADAAGLYHRLGIDAGAGDKGELTSAEKQELTQLRRDNRVLREEREILKKAAAFFAKENK
jgi:hypothetical protein